MYAASDFCSNSRHSTHSGKLGFARLEEQPSQRCGDKREIPNIGIGTKVFHKATQVPGIGGEE